MDTVKQVEGKLNKGNNLLYFEFLISVYDTSTKTSINFSVSYYFPNGKRWINFFTPIFHTRISIMGKIFNVILPQQLTIAFNDIFFFPILTHVPHTPLI